MNDVLRGLTNCVVYMDDILIYSATPEEHAGHLLPCLTPCALIASSAS